MSTLFKIRNMVLDRAMPALRKKRMALFEQTMKPKPGTRILDLGGTADNWKWVETPLDLTILNLPGSPTHAAPSAHKYHFVEGDATSMPQYADGSFDIVFSNSVIEHVGGPKKEQDFATEARRLAPAYFIQTPSKYFPYEPHTGMPFWWYYPPFLRNRVLKNWDKNLPDFSEMVKGTTFISRRAFESYFPDGTLELERLMGFPKSYVIYKAPHS